MHAGGGLRPDAQRPLHAIARPRRVPERPAHPRRRKRDRLADALIGTGFPFRDGDDLEALHADVRRHDAEHCAGLRRPGAAALDLANVAAGRMTASSRHGLNPWDVAAGALLITEAGGLVGNFTGESDFLHESEIVAGNPKVYAQMIKILSVHAHA